MNPEPIDQFMTLFERVMESRWMWFVMGWASYSFFIGVFKGFSKPHNPEEPKGDNDEYKWMRK